MQFYLTSSEFKCVFFLYSPKISLRMYHWTRTTIVGAVCNDTKKFRYQLRYFFYSIFFYTESKTIQKMEKFQNREVSKPKRHTLVVRTNTLVFQRAGRTIRNMSNFKNWCGICLGSGLFGNSWPKWLLDGLTEDNDV